MVRFLVFGILFLYAIFLAFYFYKKFNPKQPVTDASGARLNPLQYKILCKLYDILKGTTGWNLTYYKVGYDPNEFTYLAFVRKNEKLHISAYESGEIEVTGSNFNISLYEPDLAKRLIAVRIEASKKKLTAAIDDV